MVIETYPTELQEAPATPSIPHSREAEEAVIGSILINPEVYYDVAYLLRKDDFYIHRHRWIWEALGRLHESRTPVDMLTLSEEIDRYGQLGEMGGPAYLTALVNQVPTSLNAVYYAEIIVSHSLRRKAINAANTLASVAYNEETEVNDIIDTAMNEAVKLANHSNGEKRLYNAKQAAEEEFDRLERVSKEKEPDGIKTGYLDIDHIITSLAPGDLNIVAGRTGMGKTSLLQSIVHNNLKKYNKKILVAQVTDLNRSNWMQRLMAMESEIPLEIIKKGALDDTQAPVYMNAIGVVGSYPFMIDDTPNMSVEKLLSVARRAKAALFGLDLIVVDYIQKMGVPKEITKQRNRVGEIDHITNGLKFIARELDVPLLAAAQLSRSGDYRSNQRPILSDLRESGSLEQDSQIVMFIYREDQYKEDTPKKNIAEIIVAKNTNGKTGSAELVWKGSHTRFENAARY